MSTKYEFDNEAIENFCNNNGVTITLTVDQLEKLGAKGKTPLLIEQLSNVANQLNQDEEGIKRFVEQKSKEFHPVALSLYIINDSLWEIMSRKQEHTDRMLPMVTIPWFYWESEAESRINPAGIRRFDDSNNPLSIKIEGDFLMISGSGGDFAGLLESSIVDKRKGIRPIIIPGIGDTKKIVAKYESQIIQMKAKIPSLQSTLYPKPVKKLDYYYSEHPRVFYEHGIRIDTAGEEINLKVGRRRDVTLRGNAIIFIGKNFGEVPSSDSILMFHVWLYLLDRICFL
ncbi:MAG: hypothetical protein ACFFDQ_10850 [Candidatus Thorarchaeota archaeon]